MPKIPFRLLVILLILIFAVGFSVFGFTYDVSCPKCGGDGKVPCSYCNGQGKKMMPIWDDFPPRYVYGDCPVCEGTGKVSCDICEGTGRFWMLSVVGSTLQFFLLYLFTFLGFFGLDYAIQGIYLDNNPWVQDIKEMSWGPFRPLYWTWLFYHDWRRWVKYGTVVGSICTLFFVSSFSYLFRTYAEYPRMTTEVFMMGSAFGTILMILFAIAWYPTIAVISVLWSDKGGR